MRRQKARRGEKKLYIDEDLSDRIAVALRSKGFNVVSAHEVDMRGKADKEQLTYATKHGRVLLTGNVKHFVILQREYYEKGMSHNGIVVTDYLPLKELIRRITNFLNVRQGDEIKNSLDWLQNYKLSIDYKRTKS